MCDAGGELTKRSEFLRLDQAVLGGAQIFQRLRKSWVRWRNSSSRRTFSMAIAAWSAKSLSFAPS